MRAPRIDAAAGLDTVADSETRAQALATLLRSQPGLWRGQDRYHDTPGVPTGFAALDAALPSRGWPLGGVTELMVPRAGVGELSLLLPGLARLIGRSGNSRTGNRQSGRPSDGNGDGDRWALFVNPPFVPYAPALTNAGIRPERLLIVAAGSDENALWATEQALRAGSFAAVIAWVKRSSAARQRRLQLAAENGGGWAIVYRPAAAAEQHSPVTLRIVVAVRDGQLMLQVVKVRGGQPAQVVIAPAEFDGPQGVEWPGSLP